MIEIDIQKLERGTHESMVTVRRGGKVFQRKQRVGKKEVPTSTMNVVEGMELHGKEPIDFAGDHGWDCENSKLYNNFISTKAYLFMKGDKVSAIADFGIDREKGSKVLRVGLLEVNPAMQRQGHGVDTMKEIVKHAMKNDVETITLDSMDENSNKFYDAIGLEKKGAILFTTYEGDVEWMKEFIKAK